jgi:hypothetical protein
MRQATGKLRPLHPRPCPPPPPHNLPLMKRRRILVVVVGVIWICFVIAVMLTWSRSNRINNRITAMSSDALREYVAEHPSGKTTHKVKRELDRRAARRVQSEPMPRAKQKTLAIEVRWDFDTVRIKNIGSPDAAGKTISVYLNDTPPFTFKATLRFPTLGQTSDIPLSVFVRRKDGVRLDPRARAVTEAWVGGAGYDYVQYR